MDSAYSTSGDRKCCADDLANLLDDVTPASAISEVIDGVCEAVGCDCTARSFLTELGNLIDPLVRPVRLESESCWRCSECGHELDHDWDFCPQCGGRIDSLGHNDDYGQGW